MLALFVAVDESSLAQVSCCAVGPEDQLATIFEWEVEQGRQHLARQFLRYAVDPIEGLTPRQAVEGLDDATSDEALEIRNSRARRSAAPPCVDHYVLEGPSR